MRPEEFANTPSSLGRKGTEIANPGSNVVFQAGDIPKGLIVTVAGSVLKIRPIDNESEFLTLPATAGFIPPYVVAEIHSDTDCTLCTIG